MPPSSSCSNAKNSLQGAGRTNAAALGIRGDEKEEEKEGAPEHVERSPAAVESLAEAATVVNAGEAVAAGGGASSSSRQRRGRDNIDAVATGASSVGSGYVEVTFISAKGLKDMASTSSASTSSGKSRQMRRMMFGGSMSTTVQMTAAASSGMNNMMSPYATAWFDPRYKLCSSVASNAGPSPHWPPHASNSLRLPLPAPLLTLPPPSTPTSTFYNPAAASSQTISAAASSRPPHSTAAPRNCMEQQQQQQSGHGAAADIYHPRHGSLVLTVEVWNSDILLGTAKINLLTHYANNIALLASAYLQRPHEGGAACTTVTAADSADTTTTTTSTSYTSTGSRDQRALAVQELVMTDTQEMVCQLFRPSGRAQGVVKLSLKLALPPPVTHQHLMIPRPNHLQTCMTTKQQQQQQPRHKVQSSHDIASSSCSSKAQAATSTSAYATILQLESASVSPASTHDPASTTYSDHSIPAPPSSADHDRHHQHQHHHQQQQQQQQQQHHHSTAGASNSAAKKKGTPIARCAIQNPAVQQYMGNTRDSPPATLAGSDTAGQPDVSSTPSDFDGGSGLGGSGAVLALMSHAMGYTGSDGFSPFSGE